VAGAAIAVLAPAVYVSITIEAAEEGDDIHIHAGGQGVWIARMLRRLGHDPVVCAPIGGESGKTLLGLTGEWGIRLQAVETVDETAAYVHDRRDGDRRELARSRTPSLRRHEADALYDRFLELALDAGRCVITGPERDGALPEDLYRRLGADLASAGVEAVGDLHGPALDAFLDGGPLAVLKVSSGDLVEDGALSEEDRDDDAALDRLSDELHGRGVGSVVISRGGEPIFASTPDGRFLVHGPDLQAVDTKGSGDSMTAAMAAALAEGLGTEDLLARAWAAGAANVTRKGLGSGSAGLIGQLSDRATVDRRGEP
jgi:1-phosphofructokinase